MAALKKPRITKFHRLKRFKFRADMKKENLYNLSRLKAPLTAERTYFQQKWTAKSVTRAYHAEHVREGQWERMFSRRTPAVVPMDPQYLATHDGSDEAAGRGSGRELMPRWMEDERVEQALREREPAAKEATEKAGRKWEGETREKWARQLERETRRKLQARYGEPRSVRQIPYMQMVYHPLERRLDMAVYRALFASSAKQARQFVCHGGVRVNGQLMRYPGYLLNPGDMFSVDPERAMWGVGENAGNMGRMRKILESDMKLLRNPPSPPRPVTTRTTSTNASRADEAAAEDQEDPEDAAISSLLREKIDEPQAEDQEDMLKAHKGALKVLLRDTRELHDRGKAKKTISSKTKQALRAFVKDLRAAQSKVRSQTPESIGELRDRFEEISSSLSPSKQQKQGQSVGTDEADQPQGQPKRENYQTPPTGPRWHPRNWMSPFVFIPRYLEVNHAVCSAVYLRHPVCGPGFAEVPTPYGIETGGLAFNWYLRRR